MGTKYLFMIALTALSSCAMKESYLDPQLPVDRRVELLMNEMTLEDKVAQMNLDFNVPAVDLNQSITTDKFSEVKIKPEDREALKRKWIEDVKNGRIGTTRNLDDFKSANQFQKYAEESRLKIPLFIVQNFVHGVGFNGYTIFPTYVSMASSFNPELVRKVGAVIARESRLCGTNWTFAPTVDISRDSRWGRTGETWGEDPYLTSQMGVAMVKGMQYDNEPEFRIVSCLKHFVAGGQSQNGLNFSPVDISERTLREIYLPPFKAAVEAGAATVMAGHNDWQHVPCHANKFLLTDILREEYKFDGIVISDWMDIERLVTLHKVAANLEDAADMAVNAGVDIHNNGKNFCEAVLKLVRDGRISENKIDDVVRRILKIKFEYRLFENRYVDAKKRDSLICTPEDKKLALEAALQSIVLLKNNDNVLPIKNKKRVLLTGTNVDNLSILGDWVVRKNITNVIKVDEGFRMEKPDDVQLDCYSYKHHLYHVSEENIQETVRRAKKSDVVILVIGGSHYRADDTYKTGGENVDVQDINLFGNQLELLKRVKATGKPVVVVLVGGRNLALEEPEKYADAILQAWEPGMMGGQAIAQVVYGKYSPSGRLPMSVPRTTGQVNVWYNYHPSTYFRKFVFGETGALYDFGYGLSYTTFMYSDIKCPSQIKVGNDIEVEVNVTNTGDMASDEVVLCYINDEVSSVVTPVKKLVGFKRISLLPGETKTVQLVITSDAMALYDINMKRVVEPGRFTLMLGDKKTSFSVVE